MAHYIYDDVSYEVPSEIAQVLTEFHAKEFNIRAALKVMAKEIDHTCYLNAMSETSGNRHINVFDRNIGYINGMKAAFKMIEEAMRSGG